MKLRDIKVIGVVGLPGAGKGVVSHIAEDYGIKVVRMGDVIREEAKKMDESLGTASIKLREKYGKNVVAEICIEKIKEHYSRHGNGVYLVEGVRSPAEVKTFKKHFPKFRLLSIFATPKTRFKRLKKRNRADDADKFSKFEKRDKRELEFGIGTVIATSDYMIVNEGPLWKFREHVKKILEKWLDDEW